MLWKIRDVITLTWEMLTKCCNLARVKFQMQTRMYLRRNGSRRNWNICAMWKIYVSRSIFKVRIVPWLLKTIWIYNAKPILRRIANCIILISTFSQDEPALPWRFMRGFLRGIICDFTIFFHVGAARALGQG